MSKKRITILGIETSCDDTAAAVVRDGRFVLSNVVHSQSREHSLYGGVVPEIASRRHMENISGVTRQALEQADLSITDMDAIAVTTEPGLIGSLLGGLSFAKGLSLAAQKPAVAVNHLRGHIASLYLEYNDLKPPFVVFVVSGGHSHLVVVRDYLSFEVIGRAVDDAAGEAFDKVARVLDLGYPGGPEISRLAAQGRDTIPLPLPQTAVTYDVSFSGLKTAVVNLVNSARMAQREYSRADIAASFESRAVSILSSRLVKAARQYHMPAALAGGVAANGLLCDTCRHLCDEKGIALYVPSPALCGDNAAMIAAAGYFEYMAGHRMTYDHNARATCEEI